MQSENQPLRSSKTVAAWTTALIAVAIGLLALVIGSPLGTRGPISTGVLTIVLISVFVSIYMIGAEVYRRYSSSTDDSESTAGRLSIIFLEVTVLLAILTLFFLLRYG